MSGILERDILTWLGGSALQKFGTLVYRTAPPRRGGEGLVETVTRASDTGTWRIRDGGFRPAVANTPRIWWQDGEAYLIVERARTQTAANPQAPNSWTDIGTPVVTTTQTDPWGGTAAILIEDDDGAASEGRATVPSFTGDGEKAIVVVARAGTATAIRITLRDDTAGATRHAVTVTWNSGSTPPSLATLSGAGHIGFTPFAGVDGDGERWWFIPITSENVVAANTNSIQVVTGPASTDTGTFYLAGANAFNATQPGTWHDAADARNVDQVTSPWYLSGANGFQLYTRWIEYLRPNWGADERLWQLGSASAPSLFLYRPTGTDGYRVLHNNGVAAAVQTGAVDLDPTFGDEIEALMTYTAAGIVTLAVRKLGAATTTSTPSTAVDPKPWSDALLNVGGIGTSNVGASLFHSVIATRGTNHVLDEYAALVS